MIHDIICEKNSKKIITLSFFPIECHEIYQKRYFALVILKNLYHNLSPNRA